MTDITLKFPRFFVTAPGPCPYLANKQERKLFTELNGDTAAGYLEALSQAGFRRSQNVAYRPSCEGCVACVSVRVRAYDFMPSATMRRIIRRNADIDVYACEAWSTEEQYALLKDYLTDRHPVGGMSNMDQFDYADMVERSPVDTVVYEYRETANADGTLGRLIGVCITDTLSDGLSMVYSFYDPTLTKRGLGTFIILDHLLRAVMENKPYVYLGYWVKGSQKMGYKTRFQPLEILAASGWQDHAVGM